MDKKQEKKDIQELKDIGAEIHELELMIDYFDKKMKVTQYEIQLLKKVLNDLTGE